MRVGPHPAFDVVARNQHRQRNSAATYTVAITLAPAIAFLVLVINLLVRARGNTNLVLAIATKLPLSAIAVILFLGFINFMIIALGNASATLYGSPGSSQSVRRGAWAVLLIASLVSVFTLPWTIACIALISFYVYFRSETTASKKSVDVKTWLAAPQVPEDAIMRSLWLEGRYAMHSNGQPVDTSRYPIALPRPFRARKLSTIGDDILNRCEEISRSATSGDFQRVIQVLFASVAIYAAQLYATPVNFAPLERIESQTISIDTGYVIESSNSYLIVDRTLTRGEHVSSDSQMTRTVCSTDQFGKTFIQLLDRRAGRGDIDCSLPKNPVGNRSNQTH
jgi:hypothetical protein